MSRANVLKFLSAAGVVIATAIALAFCFHWSDTLRGEINTVRPLAEFAYFASNTLLTFFAAYGIQQIWLLKRDIRIRNHRAALERALEFSDRYAQCVQYRRNFARDCASRKLPLFVGEIPKDNSKKFVDSEIVKNWNEIVETKMKLDSSVKMTNTLELIAMAFTTGVADEAAGFKTFGLSFCATIATHYDIFTVRAGTGHYKHVRELYVLWSNRLNLEYMDRDRKLLEERIKANPDEHIRPIGLDG